MRHPMLLQPVTARLIPRCFKTQSRAEVCREDGHVLSGTLLDYVLPKASQVPTFDVDNVETPAPGNPLGAKGAGEAGTIAGPPTVVNAVLDALAPLGITSIDMPLRPEKVWSLMRNAGSA